MTRGHVQIDGVSFGYEEGAPVLHDVSLDAGPGERIALVGPTGAGKTTLVDLVARFHEVQGGAILIDGTDVREIPRDELRRAVGVVSQDTFLFSTTVMENIRYGRLDATDEEVVQAAISAEADAFIRKLPSGYQTVLREGASDLGRGQRQLLAIARAVLADPPLFILDEATSSVDSRTEGRIRTSLARLMKGRTSFVIAHRLDTIRDADQVLVIDHGAIVERGTHDELLARRGRYFDLYARQHEGLPSPSAETPSVP